MKKKKRNERRKNERNNCGQITCIKKSSLKL